MITTGKTKSKIKTHRQKPREGKSSKANSRQAAELEQLIIASVQELPPTENLRKYPDEVYGDTEVPRRGKVLHQLKRKSR
jgi:hypothetical protein